MPYQLQPRRTQHQVLQMKITGIRIGRQMKRKKRKS
jgi:hypothetical protein